MQIFRNAENYMVNILGLEMEDKGVYALPVPVSHFFEVRKDLIGGHEFLLLSPTMEDVKPELLCKRYYKAMEMSGIPCVLVVPTITGVLRRQLIKKKVSFIVPDKQVFIPELGAYSRKASWITVPRNRYSRPILSFFCYSIFSKRI